MWLLKLHFAFSILCLLTFLGFRAIYGDAIKENGWLSGDAIKENGWKNEEDKQKKKASGYLLFFCPVLNVLIIIAVFITGTVKKDQWENYREEHKENK